MVDRPYDYIVIGAGSAGCVVANRLGEDRAVRVLVLEAGGSDRAITVSMPAALSIPMNTRRFNWGMVTEPEPGLGGRAMNLPRGKCLGGSSSINGMCLCARQPDGLRALERQGGRGWDWAGVLPYFQRMERMREGGLLRGTDGPLKVRRGPETNPLYRAFIEAGPAGGLCAQPPT